MTHMVVSNQPELKRYFLRRKKKTKNYAIYNYMNFYFNEKLRGKMGGVWNRKKRISSLILLTLTNNDFKVSELHL